MELTLLGTAEPRGWPQPDCSCASCQRLRVAGEHRLPTAVLVDDAWSPGDPPPAGYEVRHLGGDTSALELTGPDGTRALYCRAPGRLGATVGCYDAVLLDLIDLPEQLGELRRRGAVTEETQAVAVHADHRVSSPAELRRRLCYLGARLGSDGEVVRAGAPQAGGGFPAPYRHLVLGGSRSGKSGEAERRLAGEPAVTYVATGGHHPDDPQWRERVAAHRQRRPTWWETVETTDVAAVLRDAPDGSALLVDGLGSWLVAVLDACGAWEGGAEAAVASAVDELVASWRTTRARVVAVSDEAGSGVVPPSASGRRFRDELGRLNQLVAAESEEVALVAAGRVLTLPG